MNIEDYDREYKEQVRLILDGAKEHGAPALESASPDAIGSWIAGFAIPGVKLGIDGAMTFHNHGSYDVQFGGTIDGVGLVAGTAVGTVNLWKHDPYDFDKAKLWVDIWAFPGSPLIPPLITMTFWDGPDKVGHASGTYLGIGSPMHAWGDIYLSRQK